jgi:hypothetical protein
MSKSKEKDELANEQHQMKRENNIYENEYKQKLKRRKRRRRTGNRKKEKRGNNRFPDLLFLYVTTFFCILAITTQLTINLNLCKIIIKMTSYRNQ